MFNFHTPWKYEKTNGFLMFSRGTKNVTLTWNDLSYTARKCPYSEFSWSVFSRIWTEYGEIFCISQIFCISLCSIRMRENTEQKNPNMDTFHAVFPLNTTHYIRRILSRGLTSTISQKRRIMFKNKSLSLAPQLFLF